MSESLQHYELARTDAIAFELFSFGKLSLRGKDRAAFLQNFTTNDVVKPGVGSGCETFVTTAQAKIVAWFRVSVRPEELYAHMEPGIIANVIAHLGKYVIGEQVEFVDQTDADLLWHVCGPNVVQKFVQVGIDVSSWSPWQNGEWKWGGVQVWLQRCDFLGVPGFFVSARKQDRAQVEAGLQEAGVKVLSGDDPAWTMLRVEAGSPAYGVDFDESNLPQEVNRTEQAISFTKGCYIGQETVARIRAYGHVNRLLAGVKFRDELTSVEEMTAYADSWRGTRLIHNGKEVGKVQSVAFSPRMGCGLGLALVRREHVAPGTKLQTALGKRALVEGEVVTVPLV